MNTIAPANIRGRNLGLVAFAAILIAAMIAIPLVSSASTFSAGFRVTVDGETVQNDLYTAGFDARIEADVQGDVSVAAARTTIDSRVGGSVHVLSGSAIIRGEIGGTLYVFSGITSLEGTVQGNVVMAGGRLELKDDARVQGDLLIFSAQASVDGDVAGKVYGSTLVYGQDGSISGNLELQSDRIRLGSDASIGDDFRYQSQSGANIHTNTSIGGETTRTNATPWKGVGDGALAPFGTMMRIVWSMVVGAVLIALMPRVWYRAGYYAAPMIAPGILGVLGIVLIPVLITLAMLSVVLIPLGAILAIGYVIALYLTQIVVSITIGRAIMPKRWRDGSRGFLLFCLVLGTILIGMLRMAPVPFLNTITVVIVTVWGFGAFISMMKDVSSESTRAAMRHGRA